MRNLQNAGRTVNISITECKHFSTGAILKHRWNTIHATESNSRRVISDPKLNKETDYNNDNSNLETSTIEDAAILDQSSRQSSRQAGK